MAVSINLFSGALRHEWKNFDFLYPFFMRVFTVCVYPFSYIFVAHFFCPICSTFFIRLHTNTRERRVQTTAVLLVQYLLDRLECALKGTDRANITPTFHTKWTVRYSSLLILLLVFVFFSIRRDDRCLVNIRRSWWLYPHLAVEMKVYWHTFDWKWNMRTIGYAVLLFHIVEELNKERNKIQYFAVVCRQKLVGDILKVSSDSNSISHSIKTEIEKKEIKDWLWKCKFEMLKRSRWNVCKNSVNIRRNGSSFFF